MDAGLAACRGFGNNTKQIQQNKIHQRFSSLIAQICAQDLRPGSEGRKEAYVYQ
jgi:hypothetical protein